MARPKIKVETLNKNYNDVIKTVDKGNVFIARGYDGFLTLVNNRGKLGFKFITYNPNTQMLGRVEIPRDAFKQLVNEVSKGFTFSFYSVEDNKGYDMIEEFHSIAEVLNALNGKSSHYRVRPVNSNDFKNNN